MPNLQQTWDNSQFYSSSDDPRIAATVEELKGAIATLATTCAPFGDHIDTASSLPQEQVGPLLDQVRTAHQQRTEISKQLGNLRTFISSILSVDSRDTSASQWKPTLQQLGAEVTQATTALNVFLLRVSDKFVETVIADPELEELSFSLRHQRKLQDQLLSIPEEQLVTGLSVNGLQGWGNLYTEFAMAVAARADGREIPVNWLDVPSVQDGATGVRFIDACVRSNQSDATWVNI
ncbi:MAG: M3 family oligoendopeptidase [Moorea sp. SIO3C2]|nr:M3 family oligoendopeptidase [Moorena sp. SIO3C2]